MVLELPVQKNSGIVEVGVDEAGRGCLAGPVVAAAVIFSDGDSLPSVNDSKQLSEKRRAELFEEIIEKSTAYGIGEALPEEIDEINILNASFLAMHRALEKISIPFENILVDGNRFTHYRDVKHECIVKGDSKYQCIAAASILAKHSRDRKMIELDKKFPGYAWGKNFGYPTKAHREGISRLGVTPLHRKSFNLLPKQYSLF